MAYDEGLTERIRKILSGQPGLVEKKMFGGVGFMIQGNMACGVKGDDLVVRIGPEDYEDDLSRPSARPFEPAGRPMKGWVAVGPRGTAGDLELAWWIHRAVRFALSLPTG
jgi:TfoX/Sxy family transcriptional regulator of competence genes